MDRWKLLRDLIAGVAGVLVACLAVIALTPASDLAGRAVVMAVACGILAALLTEWRATVVMAALAVVAFVTVLAAESSSPTYPWGFSPVFALAVLLGMGNRKLRAVPSGSDQQPSQR
jgi:hypothetical protein